MNAPFHRAPGASSRLAPHELKALAIELAAALPPADLTPARPLTGLSRIASNGLRIEVETVRGEAVHVRLRPDFVGPGITDGPRVALALSLEDARALGGLLLQHGAEVQS